MLKEHKAVGTIPEAMVLKADGWVSLGYDSRDGLIHFERLRRAKRQKGEVK